MDRSALSHLAHVEHPVAAPLGDTTVEDLLRRTLTGRRSVLDLGCGDGTWLLRALQMHPDLTAVGVDHSDAGFDDTRARATAAGVADRLTLHRSDARDYASPAPVDAVLSIGAAYAFGGLEPTLSACREHLGDDGVLLLADCFWSRTPDQDLLDDLGITTDEYGDLPGTIETVTRHGWVPVHGHVSSLEEWDAYEWSWTGSLARWALEHPQHPDAGQALAAADEHRAQWLGGYRERLGFLTLLLGPGGTGWSAEADRPPSSQVERAAASDAQRQGSIARSPSFTPQCSSKAARPADVMRRPRPWCERSTHPAWTAWRARAAPSRPARWGRRSVQSGHARQKGRRDEVFVLTSTPIPPNACSPFSVASRSMSVRSHPISPMASVSATPRRPARWS
ncbi:class I SAM-dependent methyltransferase [Oerskovia sp. M15]